MKVHYKVLPVLQEFVGKLIKRVQQSAPSLILLKPPIATYSIHLLHVKYLKLTQV